MTTAKDEEIFKLRSALSLARLHYEQGLYDRAEPVYRRALLFFEHGEELRQCLQCLAVLYSVRNHYSDALEMYVRLLSLNETEYGKTDRRTIAVMREMASIYVQMGQPQKAEKMNLRATVRERERERPYPDESDDEENGHGHSHGQAHSSTGQGHASGHNGHNGAGDIDQPDAHMTQSLVQKYRDELRPLISGLIVDFTSSRTMMLAKFIIAIIIFMVVLFVAMIMPRNPNPIEVYRSIPHDYQTADGKAGFALTTDSQCAFSLAGTAPPANADPAAPNSNLLILPYNQYLSDWRDVVAIIYGSIYEKQYLVSRKDHFVQDEEGRTLYGKNTPESKVIEEMNVVKNKVESFFIVKGRYPKRISEKIVLPFTNPVTNLQELPNSQLLSTGDKTWTTAKSLRERASFYTSLLNGGSWPGEPQLRPGGINTCSVVMVSQSGEFYDFLLRGADRNGKTLLTSIPGKAYVVSLQGAKELATPLPPMPFADKLLVRPRRVWLMRPGVGDTELYFLHHFLSFLCGSLAFLFFAYWVKRRFFTDEVNQGTKKYVIYAIACATLSLIYEVSLLCP